MSTNIHYTKLEKNNKTRFSSENKSQWI